MDSLQIRGSGPLNEYCYLLEDPSYFNLALSILIVIGILLSYVFQIYRIVARGTSEGISPFFILLGATSCTCALANVLALPASRSDIWCCKLVNNLECTAALLGIVQIAVQWICFMGILLLFLVFFPRGANIVENSKPTQYTWRTAVIVAFICLFHAILVLVISIGLLYIYPSSLEIWADILGIVAAILAIIQYLPQIWTTWKSGHVGSLSIQMMLIQSPGSFVWSGSLAVRLGVDGWSTWGVFLLTGCLQGSLLALGIYFELGHGKKPENANEGIQQGNSFESNDEGVCVGRGLQENRPLLGNRRIPKSYMTSNGA
ncbi:Uncharacterized protein C4C5.03 [Golovinomyces cichoracearum]|uniref:Uncharacterized protein C4C5.03 n=1 Tax=Golovinomyces cichoracearum TaxID=62708 RepID=A0A420I121_9PEZI|nr:Uncharacterized protein C4C5.03 [Golovinomyces cichoracearum]